ncbi:MAG: cysteine peptidase family C39 domain-containing protein, partial [Candidatus Omnitrophota bacterium]
MYDQTNKLWFKIISFIVLETFLFTIADISWAANYRENRGSQEALMDQRTKDSRDKLSADALSDKLVLTQPAMPYMGFEQVITKGQIEAMPIIDTTISGLSIAGNDLPTIFKTLKTSGCTVAEAGFGAVRQGFNKKEIYHALIKAGYDKDEVNTLLGGLLKAEEDAKVQETDSEESKTGPPLLKDKKAQKEEEEALKAKEGIFEIPKVTDMPVEKEPAKIIESTTKESAILRQTVEFVRIMINEGKRGAELIRILKKAGLTDERIINALAQMGFNLKDIITIFKEANISCTEIVQSIHKAQVNYSDKEIYEALLKAGFTDKDIVSAFKAAGISAGDILKIAADLSRSMTDIAQAMVDAGFRFADIARAYVLKAMKGVWDNSINLVNCAVRAFDAFLTNIGRKFASKEDLAYELIVDDILATGEVEIKGKDVMTSMMAIKNVAQKYGIGLEGFKLSIESLKELNQNAIILLDSDHWVTIVSIDGDQVTIIDNGQEQVISLTELKIRWDGTTLALNQNGQGLKYNQLLDLQMRQIRGGRSGIGGFFSSIWKG